VWQFHQQINCTWKWKGRPKIHRSGLRLLSNNFNCSTIFPENFDALADLIAAYPLISRSTHFLFVPGPLDITMNTTLPRRALLSSLIGRLKTKVPKLHLGTNPCRIKFFDQEIVIFREDLMARMLRNVVGVKPDVKSEDLKRFVSFYRKHLVVRN